VGLRYSGSGFRVQGVGHRELEDVGAHKVVVRDVEEPASWGERVWVLGFGVSGVGLRVEGSEVRVEG